jgi:hypothetical protein
VNIEQVAELLKELRCMGVIVVRGNSIVVELSTAQFEREKEGIEAQFDVIYKDNFSVQLVEKAPGRGNSTYH